MNTELNTFTYDFDKTGEFAHINSLNIRVVSVGEKPWFVATDVAILLGYSYPADSVRRHCKRSKSWKELKGVDETSIPSFGLQPATKMILESDLYRLVMRSDMPEAERFQDWVCEEVLPTIRKTGGTYMTPEHAERVFTDPDFIIKMATQIKQITAERDGALEREAEAIRTKAYISDKKTATAMQKAGALSKVNKRLKAENEALKEQYIEAPMYTTYPLTGSQMNSTDMSTGIIIQNPLSCFLQVLKDLSRDLRIISEFTVHSRYTISD